MCGAGVITNLVGDVACGAPISETGNATSAVSLAQSLCATYTAALDDWRNVRVGRRWARSSAARRRALCPCRVQLACRGRG